MNVDLLSMCGWAVVHSVWLGAIVSPLGIVVLAFHRRARPQVDSVVGMLVLATLATLPFASLAVTPTAPPAGRLPESAALSTISTMLAPWMRSVAPWLGLLWLLTICFSATRLALGVRRVRRILRTSRPCATSTSRISDAIDAPLVAGWLRPVVLLPENFADTVPDDHLQALLAHERAHVTRRDPIWNFVQCSIEALLACQPFAYRWSRHVREARENCCDDIAVAACGHADPLVHALADLAGARPQHTLGLSAASGPLARRMRRLVTPHHRDPRWPGHLTASVALAVAIFAAPLMQSWHGHALHFAEFDWLQVHGEDHRVLRVPPGVSVEFLDADQVARFSDGAMLVAGPQHRIEVNGRELGTNRAVRGDAHVVIRSQDGVTHWSLRLEDRGPGRRPRVDARRSSEASNPTSDGH